MVCRPSADVNQNRSCRLPINILAEPASLLEFPGFPGTGFPAALHYESKEFRFVTCLAQAGVSVALDMQSRLNRASSIHGITIVSHYTFRWRSRETGRSPYPMSLIKPTGMLRSLITFCFLATPVDFKQTGRAGPTKNARCERNE